MAGLTRAAAPAFADDMVAIPAGDFRMGAEGFYAEEAPVRDIQTAAFRIDRYLVTNRRFAAFVAATGYVTLAERGRAGALVFQPSRAPVPLDDWRSWWRLNRDACWRKPEGKATVFAGRLDHPVVAVAHEDAAAFAAWEGKRLPTEAEWERAAWGGRRDGEYAWGDIFMPGGRAMANTWRGRFPIPADTRARWWTSPVGTYDANDYGLFDMIGNVWEWTSDWYAAVASASCCARPPRFAVDPVSGIAHRVVKGGSFMCSPDYCARYRPAARQPQAVDTATSHIGFRCARD